ncbi:hypothetical protein [Legionella sainthelensi]|uniref:hypothetical protein n=1 Tax=Legionella sainthelensi TaxID=28087 RepID=UPI000E20A866|nr:hypothetical protein [Legionella sainthelensi]
MTKELSRPSWYSEEFYNKGREPEEWLFELWKRHQFEVNLYRCPTEQQEQYFLDFILNQQIESFLNRVLVATPPQPIKDISVSDIFLMYHHLTNSEWYKNNPNREAFESAIYSITNEGTLSREQKIAFHEMYNVPWCIFYENHQQESWCPKIEMKHLTGNPLSIDPGYIREDIITILKRKLNAWIGRPQSIECQFDRWQKSKLLAVFDLRHWYNIHQIKFTYKDIHKLIWPEGRASGSSIEEVDPDDDIKNNIKLANKVISESVISSLLIMCEAKKFKNEMIAT